MNSNRNSQIGWMIQLTDLEVNGNSSRVEKEGKLHFRIHDVILSDPNDKGDAQDLYVTIEKVESAGG